MDYVWVYGMGGKGKTLKVRCCENCGCFRSASLDVMDSYISCSYRYGRLPYRYPLGKYCTARSRRIVLAIVRVRGLWPVLRRKRALFHFFIKIKFLRPKVPFLYDTLSRPIGPSGELARVRVPLVQYLTALQQVHVVEHVDINFTTL